jgi:hypothetical protein
MVESYTIRDDPETNQGYSRCGGVVGDVELPMMSVLLLRIYCTTTSHVDLGYASTKAKVTKSQGT